MTNRRRFDFTIACCAAATLSAAPVCAGTSGAPRIEYDATVPIAGIGFNIVTGVVVDPDGNVWLAGTTTNRDFPITDDAADTQFLPGDFDEGFVAKLDASGELVYATFLGGSNVDNLGGIALTAEGGVVVAGATISDDFPITPGAYQSLRAGVGTEDAFLTLFDADGRLLESTYFGGNGRDLYPRGRGGPQAAVAVASDGSIYLAGGTSSTDLPAQFGDQRDYGGGTQDAFLARFGSDLSFQTCTYLGGANNDGAYRVALDADDNVYLLGLAQRIFGAQWGFPVTAGAYQTDPTGDPLLFVASYDPTGAKRWATFLGPDEGDTFLGQFDGDLAVDRAGNVVVAATVGSVNYPVTDNAFQSSRLGFTDLVVSVLAADGASLLYSTYLGGSAGEQPDGPPGVRVGVDSEGAAYVAGFTFSIDFPRRQPLTTAMTGPVFAKLDTTTGELLYSSGVPIGPVAVTVVESSSAALSTSTGPIAYIGGTRFEPPGIGAISIADTTGGGECAGDCNGDGSTRINELIIGVRIALAQSTVAACPSFDGNGDGRVVISELIAGVRSSLQGCAAAVAGAGEPRTVRRAAV